MMHPMVGRFGSGERSRRASRGAAGRSDARALLVAIVVGAAGCRAAPAPAPAPGAGPQPATVRIHDLYGRAVDPFRSGGRPVVCVFAATDCPESDAYASEVRRLAAAFGGEFDFWVVYPDSADDALDARRHAQGQEWGTRVARDPRQALARLARVDVTPAAAVFDAGGELVYSGRIDDTWVARGRARSEPTVRDLERVLLVLLGGAPAGFEASLPIRTRAIGRPLPPAS